MNEYVERYIHRRNEGFQPLKAFGIVASSIAISGTIDDLKQVDRAFQNDLTNELEELNNERITSTVSAI